MIRLSSPWAPAFTREFPRMGQQIVPLAPPTPPVSPAIALGAGALVLGLSSVGVLFTYGIARESRNKLVKTTGYIMAGVGAIAALAEAVVVGSALMKSI